MLPRLIHQRVLKRIRVRFGKACALAALGCALPHSLVYAAQPSADELAPMDEVASMNDVASMDKVTADAKADTANEALSPVALRARMRASSDSELTALTARWAELSAGERRALQTEMLGRMSKARRAAKRQPVIRVRRQYGRRQADGSVIVRTEVLDLKPRASAAEGKRRVVTFGVGFERRKRALPAQTPGTSENQPLPASAMTPDASP